MVEKPKKQTGSAGAVFGFIFVTLVLCVLCMGVVLLAQFFGRDTLETDADPVGTNYTLVIDAGHGGIDSGAIGTNGIEEKIINLSVAKKLYELCRLAGVKAVLTRTGDAMLVDDSVKSHRKMQDLKNRVAFAEGTENALFVSIHMNTYSSSRYSGLQVWYSKNDDRSRSVASYIQTYARTFIDENNTREIKPTTSAIYILDRIRVPAVLVECGFLSNPAECEKLCSDAYQTELAVTLFAALSVYMSGG